MKKLILILVTLQLFAFSIAAQTDKEKLKQLNQETVNKFKADDIDAAFTVAKDAVDLGSRIAPTDNETAAAYFNLGLLYRVKKKYKEAIVNLEKALAVYRLDAAKNGKSLAKTASTIAEAYGLDGDEKRAAENYTLAFNTAEAAFGKDAKELLPYLKSMSDVYVHEKKWDEAQETFVRRHQLTSKYFPNNPDTLELINDDFYCFVNNWFVGKELVERTQRFRDAVKTEEEKELEKKIAEGKIKTVSGGVINSTATNLVKPAYPPSARARRARGKVTVRVTIDEEGKVSEARAICGDKDLLYAAQAAAKQSRFKPTKLAGQPVKVTGFIVYMFIAP